MKYHLDFKNKKFVTTWMNLEEITPMKKARHKTTKNK
jgi:hypothetical protein